MAEALAGAGPVAVAGRTATRCEAAVERVTAAGSEGLAIAADATDEADGERMVAETVERFGRIDISSTPSVAAPARCSTRPRTTRARLGLDHGAQRPQHGAPDTGRRPGDDRAGRGGAVLNITSVRAILGINAGYSAYVAAKGAIAR